MLLVRQCSVFVSTLRKGHSFVRGVRNRLSTSSLAKIQTRRFGLFRLPNPVADGPFHTHKCLSSSETNSGTVDRLTFNSVCTETLDSLSEYFEELIDSVPHLKHADVTYSDGVLTVQFGQKYGTYVINRQTPNLQIWLSSPTSGPKRYDFMGGTWVYKHDKSTLHSLLDEEIKEIANQKVEFVEKCMYAKPSE